MTAAYRGFVVVSGPPASGKSTLATALAAELDLPLLAKDVVKDALVDTLGAPDLPRSRELGTAAEPWNADVGTPVAGGWPVLEVDTTTRPDVTAPARRIVAAAS